jgi:Ca2+-binding EF-hand superfamily protein
MGQMADGADANADGIVSPDEMRAALAGRLATFDTDGDGTLSLAEFEAMHAAMIRPIMVDRFQALDEDGDGRVTADEMTAPADQMQRMMQMRARIGGAGSEMNGPAAGRMMTDN